MHTGSQGLFKSLSSKGKSTPGFLAVHMWVFFLLFYFSVRNVASGEPTIFAINPPLLGAAYESKSHSAMLHPDLNERLHASTGSSACWGP